MKSLKIVLIMILFGLHCLAQTDTTPNNSTTPDNSIKGSDEDLKTNQPINDRTKEIKSQNTKDINNSNQESKNYDEQSKEKTNKQNNSSYANIDGLMMKDGKIMMVRNGFYTAMNQSSLTLKDGTIVYIDGTIVKNGVMKPKLKEGEEIKMSGEIVSVDPKLQKMERTKENTKDGYQKNKTMYLVPDTIHKK